MRQQASETLKSYLVWFTDEMTYYAQVIDKEALSTLRGGLNMNFLFWRDVRNQNSTTYDALIEIMRIKIINEKLINHRDQTSLGLPPP